MYTECLSTKINTLKEMEMHSNILWIEIAWVPLFIIEACP